jgi:acetyl esterase/lipase
VGEPADDAVIFYIHGGCYVSGSVGSIREFAARLSAASRARVLTVDYRLAPEHPCPAALDDVACAYNWLVSDVGASRVVVAGESAGGGLTVALMVALRDSGRALPAAAVPISPWADLSMTNPSLTGNEEADALGQLGGLVMGAEAYLGDRPATDPQASPVHADLAGMPPMLVQVGTGEILFDDAVQLVGALERAGGDVLFERYEEMFHIWHYFGAFLPEGQAATDAIATFVRKHVPFIA